MPVSDPHWSDITTLHEVPGGLRREIEHFFTIYKDLEPNKRTRIEGWDDETTAFRNKLCYFSGARKADDRRTGDRGSLQTHEWKNVGPHPVLRHQQPAAASLLDRVQTVAGHPLRDLREKGAVIKEQQSPQGTLPAGLVVQRLPLHPQGIARDLHDHAVGRRYGP